MRSHSKASTAGSTQRQAKGFGRILRGAFATRGASPRAEGSSAPASRYLKPISALALVCALFALAAAPAQAVVPAIGATWSQDVAFTEATLKAEIDPEGLATTYRFEYGTSEAYGQQTSETAIGSGTALVKVTRFLTGLQPDTTYHYRVVATNADGANPGPDRTFTTFEAFAPKADCPNQSFRYGSGANLPDCRGYEMVSPVEKGGDIFAPFIEGRQRGQFMQSSLSGNKFAYSSFRAFGDTLSGLYVNQYLASRGTEGWSTHSLNAPQTTTIFDPFFQGIEQVPFFQAFTPDLSSGWMTSFNKTPLTSDGLVGYVNVYRRDNTTDSFEALTNEGPYLPKPNVSLGQFYRFGGASSDLSHQVFTARGALTPDAGAHTNAQVYDLSGGELHLVSVLPNGEANPQASFAGGVGSIDGSDALRSGNEDNAVSEDGSRIFWVSGATDGNGPFYVRENPAEEQSAFNGSGECTEPAKACTRPLGSGLFWGASPDGSNVLFSGEPSSTGVDELWLFDVDAEAKTDIAGEVAGVLGAADDLSRVYFASKEDLALGATAGGYNLYVYHEGAIDFIGTLSEADRLFHGWAFQNPEAFRNFRVTPDGRHLAFMSNVSLTGYDNTDAASGQADLELFVYDAEAEQLACASCNPSGARPSGAQMPRKPWAVHVDDGKGRWAGAWIPVWERSQTELRPLSADGNRLFFNAFDALVPRDTNGKQDVYQWQALGTGDCTEASPEFSEINEGCVSLISSGESAEISEFLDASLDGSNVFFETSSSLYPEDPGLIDIYNARVEGGYQYVPPSEPCAGDACQSVPPLPNDPTPASASFRGAGDPAPVPNCSAQARRAAKLARQAKGLRAKANRSDSTAQAEGLRERAARLSKRSRQLGKSAKRCRRANRRAAR